MGGPGQRLSLPSADMPS
ncbi:hypothetical protein CEXT_767781, partial [Caerostris extrusa]